MRSAAFVCAWARAVSRRACAAALVLTALAAPVRSAELARADLSILGISVEVERRQIVTAPDIAATVQTIFGGHTGDDAPPAPELMMSGDLTGPGIETPIPLSAAPGQKFSIPPLHVKGEYSLQNIRLITIAGKFVQQAVPAFATILVADVLSTAVTVKQLTPDELRARGITLDPRNYDAYSYSIAMTVGSETVIVPYVVLIDRRTREVITPPGPIDYAIPQPSSNAIPPRFEPPMTLPIFLSDAAEDVPFTPGGGVVDHGPVARKPTIPATVVIPNGFGVLHQFFAILLNVSNIAPAGNDIRIDSISATLDAPLELRLARSVPAIAVGQPLPIVDKSTGSTVLVAGAQGTGEWSVEALKSGTHTIDIDVRATYRAPGQADTPLRGKLSASIVVTDPRFHVTFSHPDVVRHDEPYIAFSFVTNLTPQSQTVRLDLSGVLPCAQGYTSEICRDDAANGIVELTIGPGAMETVAHKLKSRIDGHFYAAAAAATDAAVGVDVKLRMGVSASGIPLSPATLIMPWYARYLDAAIVNAELPLLGLAYSLATAPLNATTSRFPRILRSDVFRRAQDIARAGQRLFVSRHDASGSTADESRRPTFNLALDLLDNVERVDRLSSTPELREFDALRRFEASGRRAAAAMSRQLEAIGLAGSRSISQFVDDFAAATAHRSPFLFALVHGSGGSSQRPFALSLEGTSSGGRLDIAAESVGTNCAAPPCRAEAVRTLPYAELTTFTSASERGELALVGRWKEDIQLSVVPQSDRFTVELIFPDTADGAFAKSSFEVTGATPGTAVTFTVARGSRTIVVAGATANPLVTAVPPPPLAVLAAAQDLHLDDAGHVVSMLFNRPIAVADAATLRDSFSLTTAIAAASYEVTRRNVPGQLFIPGAALQDDGTIVNLSFDKALSTNATYALTADAITDAVTRAPSSFTGIVARIDNDRAGGILTGRLLRGDNSPVSGGTVQLLASNRYQYDTTGPDGRFAFEFIARDIDRGEAGNYTLSALADGRYTEAQGAIRLPREVQTVNLTFLGRGSATGIVRYSDSTAVVNASVAVVNPVAHQFRTATTDAQGRYSTADLPVGPLSFAATDAAGRTAYATSQIRIPGEVVSQDLTIQKSEPAGIATVRVTVRRSDVSDPSKSGVPNARVGVYSRGYGITEGTTDANGWCEFRKVPAGFVSILAAEFNLTRESAAIDLEVRPDAVIDQTIVLHVPTKVEEAALVTVQGTITRDDPAAPADTSRDSAVSGAVVTIPGLAATTADVQGGFVYTGVPPSFGSVRSMQVFDPSTGRVGTFVLPTLLPGTNQFSVRLRSSAPAGAGTMRVRLFGARGEAVSGYRVLSPYSPPIEFTESSTGVYDRTNVSVPQRYDVWAVPKDRSGSYGDQWVRGSVRVDFDGQTGSADVHLPGQGTLVVKLESEQPCANPPCYAAATGPVNVRYLTWDDAQQSAVSVQHRFEPDPATGFVTAPNIPAGQDVTVSTIDNPAGFASAITRLAYDGDSKTVTLRLASLAVVTGQVLMFDGQTPVPGASVRIEGSIANVLPVTTGAAGTFTFGAVAANQSIRVVADVTQDGIIRTGIAESRTPATGGVVANVSVILREQSSVEGRVVDAAGTPVPLARYWLRELRWPYRTFGTPAEPRLCDSEGRFVVGNVFSGPFRVTAVSPEVQELRGDYQGEIAFEGDTSQQSVALRIGGSGAGSLTVAVVNPQQAFARVANAEVALLRGGTPFDFTTTDASGLAVFDQLPAGTYALRGFSKSLGRTGSSPDVAVAAGVVTTATITLEFRGIVSGIVRDPEALVAGAVVAGAPVTLRQTALLTRSSTGSSGTFEFSGIPEGPFTLEALDTASGRRGNGPPGLFISKLYPERTAIEIELERTAKLRVRVFLPDDTGKAGQLAPLASVIVRQDSSYLQELQGNDLTFARLFVKKPYSIEAKELGGEGRTVKATGAFANAALDGEVSLVFPTSGRVEVTVVDAGGAAVSDARVTISGGGRTATLYTPSTGKVSLDGFALGSITVQAQKGSVAASIAGTLGSHATPLSLTLNLGATASIAGGVDAESGGPSAGTRVVARVTSQVLVSALQLETVTDASGAYRFDAIPVATTSVTISCLTADELVTGATVVRSIADGTTGVIDLGRVRLDGTAPRVVSIDPPNNSNNVSPNSVVVVTLSETLPPSFVSPAFFQLISAADGQVVRNTFVTSQPGAGGTFVVTITAPDPSPEQIAAGQKYRLKSNAVYRVVVAAGIQDATGNAMRSSPGAAFTTVNYTEPVITSVNPPVDAPLPQQTTFRVKFNKAIDDTSFSAGNGGVLRLEQLASYKGDVVASIEVTYYRDPVDATTLVVAPRAAIAESAFYRLTVAGTRDTQAPPNVQPSARTFDYFSFDRKKPVLTIDSPVPEGFPLITGVGYAVTPIVTDEGTQNRATDTAYVDWLDASGNFLSRGRTSPFAYTFVAPAASGTTPQLTLKATATDLSGNVSEVATRTWPVAANEPPRDVKLTLDTTAGYPSRTVNGVVTFGDEGLAVTVALKLTGSQRDGSPYTAQLGSVKVSRATVAAAWTEAKFTFTIATALKEGSATITASATDSANQTTSTSAALEVLADTVAPEAISLLPKPETHFTNGQTMTVEVTARDRESGVARASIAIGAGSPVTILAGGSGSSVDSATGVWTFRTSVTVPRRNADTRMRITATISDNRDNATTSATDVIYDRVDDPAVPKAAWVTPLDGAALPIGAGSTTLRIAATGNITQVTFRSSAMTTVVLTAPKSGTTDVYETKAALNIPADGTSFVITATVSDGVEEHLVELPITVDAVKPDVSVVSNEIAITASNIADYANKSVVLSGVTAKLFAYVPVTFKNLLVLDGALVSNPTQTKLDLTIADRFFVDGDSMIDVTARGYLGGWALRDDGTGRNDSQSGRTAGGTTTGGALAAGSHGGSGGESPDLQTNLAYGSISEPDDFGAGGGGASACCVAGGSGGGAIALRGGMAPADLSRFVIAGTVAADGQSGRGRGFAGAGGSVIVRGRTVVTGAGTRISANGGDDDAAIDESRGGGGGRVAISVSERFDCSDIAAALQAHGGRNGTTAEAVTYTDGGAGTILLRRPTSTSGELVVSSFDRAYPLSTHATRGTPIATAVTADAITVGPRALARFDAPYSVASPSMVKVDATALLLQPTDVPAVSVTSTEPTATLVQDSSLVATFSAAAIDGIDHVRMVLSVADDRVRTFGAHPVTLAAQQLTISVPATAATGAAALKLRAVSRGGRVVETAAIPFSVVANAAPTITKFDLTPPAESYAGRTIAVAAAASDDVEVKSLALTSTAGTVTASSPIADAATHTLTQNFSIALPPTTPSGTSVQVTLTAADSFPGRAATTQSKTVTILKDQAPPAVSVSQPAPDQVFDEGTGNSFVVEATIIDSEVAVKRAYVSFEGKTYDLAAVVGRANVYRVNVPVPSVDGIDLIQKALSVTASDYEGNSRTSEALTIRIRPLNDPNAPALSWTCGTAGAVYPSGGSAKLRVYAKGNTTANGVARVEFSIGDPASVLPGSAVPGVADNYEVTYAVPSVPDTTLIPVRVVATSVGGNSSDLSTAVVVYGGTVFTTSASIAATDAQYDGHAVFVKGTGVTLTISGHHDFTAIGVLDGAVLTHPATAPTSIQRVDIGATAIYVSCDSRIDVTGRGFAGYVSGTGYTYKDATSGSTVGGSSSKCGGSHGGRGGWSTVDESAAPYGSPFDPNEPGGAGSSGGSCATCVAGGGIVRLNGTTVTIDGSIVANGVAAGQSGQGAGGSIRIDGATVAGNGQLHADGGDQYQAGGGGRIAIYYQALQLAKTGIVAAGGDSGSTNRGTAGTVYLRQVDSGGNKVSDELISDNGSSPTTSRTTPFAPLGSGTVTSISGGVVTLSAAVPEWVDGSWIEFLDATGAVASTYRIAAHGAQTVTLDVPSGATLAVAAGTAYRGMWRFDAVTLRNYATVAFDALRTPLLTTTAGAYVTAALLRNESVAMAGAARVRGTVDVGQLTLDSTSTLEVDGVVKSQALVIRNNSKLLQLAPPMPAWGRLTIDSGTVSVDASSTISATGRGLAGGVGLYAYTYKDATSGTITGGSFNGAGGSHGGRGADGEGVAAASYGSLYDPNEPGGSGSRQSTCATCLAGGGVIRLRAESLLLDGTIVANGIAESYVGQGAGGSIRLDVPVINGSGQIHADGGPSYRAGGGGRVAIYYQSSTLLPSRITAAGGTGERGAAGTVFLKRSDQSYGELIVDNLTSPVGRSTTLPAIGMGTITSVDSSSGGTVDRMTDSLASFEAPDTLAGLRLFVNGDRAKTWVVTANDARSLTVNTSSAAFTGLPGQSYRGLIHFDAVKVRYSVVTSVDVIDALSVDKDSSSIFTHNDSAPLFTAALKPRIVVSSVAAGDFVVGPAGAVVDTDSPVTMTATNQRTLATYSWAAAADGSFSIPVEGLPGDTFTLIAVDSHILPLTSERVTVGGAISEANFVAALTLLPSTITGGDTAIGSIRLQGRARVGGCRVALTSSLAVAVVPADVTVPYGSFTAQFSIATTAVASASSAAVRASLPAGSQSATLQIVPGTGALASITISPESLTGGATATATVLLSTAAPVSGAVVALASSAPLLAAVPPSVTVPSGATSVSFTITTVAVPATTPVLVSASYGNTQSATVTLTACTAMASPPSVSPPSTDIVWVEDAMPNGATAGETGASFTTTYAVSGTKSLEFAAGSGVRQWSFSTGPGLAAGLNDRLVVYVLIDPCNPPRQIVFSWSSGGTGAYRATWGDDVIDPTLNHKRIAPMPGRGSWQRLEVAASAIGAGGHTLNGLTVKVYDGHVWFDRIGRSACSITRVDPPSSLPNDRVWVDDDVPEGATTYAPWQWDPSQAASGTRSHHLGDDTAAHSDRFDLAIDRLAAGDADVLVTYVLLSPCRAVRELMLTFIDENGGVEHRAYWGENLISGGTDGTASRMRLGALPEAGAWVRLEVPAALVAMDGRSVRGMYFSLYGGEAWFDRIGAYARANVAAGKSASQSSTLNGQTAASRAVDGDTSGNGEPLNAITTAEATPWWSVDLGSSQPVEHVVLWNRTDCCASKLAKFWLFASESPFASNEIAATRAQSGVASFYYDGTAGVKTILRINGTARFLRVQLSGTDTLQLAELQAFAPSTSQPVNVAAGLTPAQSSTNGSAGAERAVDGNADGKASSSSDTGSAAVPYWQLDLGSVRPISAIDVWGRTDCCATSLAGFYLFLSDSPFTSGDPAVIASQSGVTPIFSGSTAMNAFRFVPGRAARYIRIQLTGTGALTLGEVQVWSDDRVLTPLGSGDAPR